MQFNYKYIFLLFSLFFSFSMVANPVEVAFLGIEKDSTAIDSVQFDMPYPTELDKYYDTPATPNPGLYVHRNIERKIQTGEPITYTIVIPYPSMSIGVQKLSLEMVLKEVFSDFDNSIEYVETAEEADFKYHFQPEGEILKHLSQSSFKPTVLGLAIMPSPKLPDYLLGNIYFNASKTYSWLNSCLYINGKLYAIKNLGIHETFHSCGMNHSTTANCERQENGALKCPCEVMRPAAISMCDNCQPTVEEKTAFKVAIGGSEWEENEHEGDPRGNEQDSIIASMQLTIDSLQLSNDNLIQSQIDFVELQKDKAKSFRQTLLDDFRIITKIWVDFNDRLNLLNKLKRHE